MTECIYQGDNLSCLQREGNIVEIIFDHKQASVNKFDLETLSDLEKAMEKLKTMASSIKGVLVTSAKDVFIVGADVTEFPRHLQQEKSVMEKWLTATHQTFNILEDLMAPSVIAVNGICLGGGFEFALAGTYRVASSQAKLGLPETKLGIYPGWGGTIRLPRLVGADNAIEWIAQGSTHSAEEAWKIGAVDTVVAPDKLKEAAMHILHRAIKGELDWQAKRQEKIQPLTLLSPVEAAMVFEGSKGFVAAKAGPNYPAPVEAIKAMQKSAMMNRDEAIPVEIEGFIKMGQTNTAHSLVSIFLADQYNKKKSKTLGEKGQKVKKAAVLGAGIMGGGIAYQTASSKIPILMKDITVDALQLGMAEATKLLTKQVERKKLTPSQMAQVVAAITPTQSYGDFAGTNFVVEAIVENEGIKKKVLKEVESQLPADSVLSSNTSTISINKLAEGLARPEQFCGVHFFNPVHRMPLVEIIRGEKTSEETVATAVNYALSLKKVPVVVNDCAGFLVNRVLFPYFYGLLNLLNDGVEFKRIDKVMEKFGWPMGPAYLVDVIGIDTCVHAADVMSKAYPERMTFGKSALHTLHDHKRLGQKNQKGFYQYTLDKKGKPKKSVDDSVFALLPEVKSTSLTDEEIVNRMMVPMINECTRCLSEKIVDTPMELDLGLIYGIGFPPFLGGALRYVDSIGLNSFIETAKALESYGPCYQPTELMQKLAKENKTFYSAYAK